MQKDTCDLTSCFLCRNSMNAWKKVITAHKTSVLYKKGEIIFEEGATVTGIFFVFKGTVKVHKYWGSDKQLILRFAKAGDALGHRGLGGTAVYPVSATALENTTVCFVDNDFFEASLHANTQLTHQLMRLYADDLQKAETRMTRLAHMDVKGRIAEAILELRSFFGSTPEGFIDMAITRQDIASFAGTTYETIFKLFTEWTKENIIKTEGKNLAIMNEKILKSFIT